MSKTQPTERLSTLPSLSPRTPAATELLNCFKTLAKHTEPKELQGPMARTLKLMDW